MLWRNKGTVAVGTAATVAVLAPEATVQGATTVATQAVQGATAVVASGTEAIVKSTVKPGSANVFLTLFLLVALLLAGLWIFIGRIRRKYLLVLPILVLAVLVFGGVAHAGIVECGIARPPLWWGDIFGFILLIIATIFMP